MKRNMSNVDRVIRVLLAAIFGVLYFTGTITGIAGIILLVLGIVFVVTGILGFCPVYSLAGFSTCPPKKA